MRCTLSYFGPEVTQKYVYVLETSSQLNIQEAWHLAIHNQAHLQNILTHRLILLKNHRYVSNQALCEDGDEIILMDAKMGG